MELRHLNGTKVTQQEFGEKSKLGVYKGDFAFSWNAVIKSFTFFHKRYKEIEGIIRV